MSSVRVHKQSFAGAFPHSFVSPPSMVLLGHFDRAEWLPETNRALKSENIYFLLFYGKQLLIPRLNKVKQKSLKQFLSMGTIYLPYTDTGCVFFCLYLSIEFPLPGSSCDGVCASLDHI